MASSYNELFGLGSHSSDANLEGWWPLQDDAASTSVDDASSNGNDGTLQGGNNTSDLSTTGPNSWLTKSLSFDGSADYITLGTTFDPASAAFSVLARAKHPTTAANRTIVRRDNFRAVIRTITILRFSDSAGALQWYNQKNGSLAANVVSGTTTDDDDTWRTVAGTSNGSNSAKLYVDTDNDGSSVVDYGDLTQSSAVPWCVAAWEDFDGVVNEFFAGEIADVSLWSRELSSTEVAQWDAGPEPVVTSGSDTVSGTETVGSTLSASSATWGLDSPFASGSNGTITYTYQWTRSDDASGTNEADISGATSATYTLQAADSGKYIRRRTRASNDGGYDSAADHNSSFTGAIAPLGGVVKTRPFIRSFQPAFQGAF